MLLKSKDLLHTNLKFKRLDRHYIKVSGFVRNAIKNLEIYSRFFLNLETYYE